MNAARPKPWRWFNWVLVAAFALTWLAGCRTGTGELVSATITPASAHNGTAELAAIKLLVTEAGIYRIEAGDLRSAGWTGTLESAGWNLYYRGQPQPFWAQGQGNAFSLDFYAQSISSRYTRQNVYWLFPPDFDPTATARWSTGLDTEIPPAEIAEPILVGDETGPAMAAVGAYQATIRVEENRLYNPQVETGDHFLWLVLPAPKTQDFTAELANLLPGPGRVQVEVVGTTEAPAETDHHLRVLLNGQLIIDEKWDGKGRRRLTGAVPTGAFLNGRNTLTLEAPGDSGAAADIVALDWFAIDYPAALQAQNDRLEFTSDGSEYLLSGFTGQAEVYDISAPPMVSRLAGQMDEEKRIRFRGEAGHRYIVVGPQGARRPQAVQKAVQAPDLRAAGGADYVAIGPAEFLAPLEPLLQHRRDSGLQVRALPLEAIYDQFAAGLRGPEGLRAFLRYASSNWRPSPRFVFLVGDTTYDPLGNLVAPEVNRTPTFFITTNYGGETASDVIFAQLDEDLLPDLAIGRIPAASPVQVETYVRKILAYEQAEPAAWSQRILAVADGQEASFKADAQAFLDRFDARFQKELLAPAAGSGGINQQIQQRFAAGYGMIGYFGHGSLTMWGKDQLFTIEDVADLTNRDHLPVVLNMTCLTGLFTHPKVESLAEALLWKADGGAVAVLAPTSLTLPGDQSVLSQAFVEAWLANPDQPLGELLRLARRQAQQNSPAIQEVMETFLLFGDPALKMK